MMPILADTAIYDTNSEKLKILSKVRLIAISAHTLLIMLAAGYLDIRLPLVWLFSLVLAEVVFQWYGWYRSHSVTVITSVEILIHLLFDSMLLAGLVYFSGGPHNPFIYLLLLPLALGTMMLRPRDLLIIATIQIGLYSFLNLYSWPLQLGESSPLGSFHLHLMGMWVNFGITVALIAIFGLITRQAMVKKELHIQSLREQQLKDEQVLSLGIMSASAAHELGTPLSTMAIVVDDLRHDPVKIGIADDLGLLSTQINNCRNIIQSLSNRSQSIRLQLEQHQTTATISRDSSLMRQLEVIVENWLVYRPQIALTRDWSDEIQSAENQSLAISVEQAVTNLLDNAADASLANNDSNVLIRGEFDCDDLIIEIVDQGQGITAEIEKSLGTRIQTTKKRDGLGWGLFLSNASIERVGGQVELLQVPSGGTLTRICIPAAALRPEVPK